MKRWALRHIETKKYPYMKNYTYAKPHGPSRFKWSDEPMRFYNREQDAIMMCREGFEVVPFELIEVIGEK